MIITIPGEKDEYRARKRVRNPKRPLPPSLIDSLAAQVLFFLDVETGNDPVVDSAGNYVIAGNNLSNVVDTVQFFGQDSLAFNGTNQYLNLTPNTFSLSGSFNIEAWINTNASGQQYVISRYVGSGTPIAWALIVDPANNRLRFRPGDVNIRDFVFPDIPLNQNIHVSIDREIDQMRAWLNGVESTTGAITVGTNFTFATTSTQIGRFNIPPDGGYLSGFLSQLKVTDTTRYNAPFTPVRLPKLA